jgi:hypothetical protein
MYLGEEPIPHGFFISLPLESLRNPTGSESHRKTEVF